ncbi:MAG: efflux RND transporter permease subunit, partial [Cetobacterium sp.]
MDACLESSKTLAIPLFVSSLTTIMAFSPIILNKQNMGEYVGPLTIVVMLALMSSWLINQTFIPLLCYDFIKLKPGEKQNLNSKPYLLYREILIKVLKNKKITIVLTAISFIFGIWLLGLAPSNFMPGSTDPVMSTYITLPKGTDVDHTRAVVEDLNKFIEKNYSTGPQEPLPPGLWDYITTGGTTKTYDKAGVLSWGSFIGGGAPRFSTGYSPQTQLPEYAYIMYNLTDYRLIPKLSQEINQYLINKYPDIDVVSKGLGSGVSLAKDLGYVFASRDIKLLKKVAEEVKAKLTSLDGTYAVSDDWGIEVPKIFIEVDTEKAQMAGFTNDTIGTYLQYVLQGYNASVY